MNFKDAAGIIMKEIGSVIKKVEEKEVKNFISSILDAEKVFVTGAGRVKLMMQAFAKRLRHLGLESYVVGETTVPAIGKCDLLIAASGSGETLTTVDVARLAKKQKGKLVLITASPGSTLKRISDLTVRIPCSTKYHLEGEFISRQPMTSLFEQSLLVFCDGVTMMLKEQLKISEKEMWRIHCNLE